MNIPIFPSEVEKVHNHHDTDWDLQGIPYDQEEGRAVRGHSVLSSPEMIFLEPTTP
jgi:hypothetical protein